MYKLLQDLRVIEAPSFIASPLCGLYLQQMGADVIRIDSIGGGPDFRRWPLSPEGSSFYWEGLNKGKKSITIDLSRPEGRELAVQLVTAPGEQGGLFVTNFPVAGFLSHARLAALRPDLITVRIMGWPDGEAAVDYTVNCAVGLPSMTGPALLGESPVNHVLPAWDLLTGAYAAFGLLAAEHHRRATGLGQEVRIPLSDVAITSVAHLGQLAEVMVAGADRPRVGNDVFGAFGRDFVTCDGRRLMIIAITPRQWTGLLKALDLMAPIAALEQELGVSFERDEGLRFEHRQRLFPLVDAAVARRHFADVEAALNRFDVCWGPYQTLGDAALNNGRLVRDNPAFTDLDQPSGYRYPVPGAAATLTGAERLPPTRAPRLGEHTDQVLAEVLGLSSAAISHLHDAGIVASPVSRGN